MSELGSKRHELPESLDDVYDYVMRQGWGDGLPIVPPTEDRVQGMLDYTGRAPGEVVARVAPLDGEATVEKIAVNAVMAGCRPEYLPVVIAAVEAMAAPEFHLGGIQTTTNPVGPVLIINGPARQKLNVNCALGCMGPGWRANATIGRAVRLVLLNIGGGAPDTVDRAIHGMPGKYTFCFGEDEEGSPWAPLHVERGCDRAASAVTVTGGQGTHNNITNVPSPELFIKLIANAMSTWGNNNMAFTQGEPLVVLTSAHAAILAKAGFTKSKLKEAIFALAGAPVTDYPAAVATPSKPMFVLDGLVKPCEKPEDIMVVVTGSPVPYHIVVIPTFGDTRAVTRQIKEP
ncbi:MAG: hypothetical protein HYX96_09455 [Chloroflexi bacterium]|nr:hypothetical protein [Chloroflexota bacterium]